MNRPDIEIGTILEYSIGCGCDEFWQVISRTAKTVTVRKIKEKIVNRKVQYQTCDYLPLKDEFYPPDMQPTYIGGYKDGESKFKDKDVNTIKLKLSDDGRIGPQVRMMWWKVWNGKPQNQWSS